MKIPLMFDVTEAALKGVALRNGQSGRRATEEEVIAEIQAVVEAHLEDVAASYVRERRQCRGSRRAAKARR